MKKTKKEKVVKKNPNTLLTETNRPDSIDMDPNMEFCLKKIPIPQARIERIKDKLRVWLDENPGMKSISKFFYAMDLSSKTYYRLLQRDPELAELHEITMRRMGDKLWEDSVDCRANWNAVKFKLHQYAPEYREAREFEASLSKKEDAVNTGPQFIVMENFPSSDKVPVKKDEK